MQVMAGRSDYRTYNGITWIPDALWPRDILSRDSGSFTVLSVDRFRGPRRGGQVGHHGYWELVVVLGGTGELAGLRPLPLSRGDVVLVPPGVAHDEVAPEMLDTVWVAMTGGRLRDRGDGVLAVRDEELCRLGEELWMQVAVRTQHSGGELDGLALTLLGRFLRVQADGPVAGDLVDQAVRWLHQHLDRPVQVVDLARQLRISPAHLHRQFRQRTRRSPKVFLNALRMERAVHLLRHTALPAARIAALVGFSDPLYFSRAFTRAMGQPPSRFRAASD